MILHTRIYSLRHKRDLLRLEIANLIFVRTRTDNEQTDMKLMKRIQTIDKYLKHDDNIPARTKSIEQNQVLRTNVKHAH